MCAYVHVCRCAGSYVAPTVKQPAEFRDRTQYPTAASHGQRGDGTAYCGRRRPSHGRDEGPRVEIELLRIPAPLPAPDRCGAEAATRSSASTLFTRAATGTIRDRFGQRAAKSLNHCHGSAATRDAKEAPRPLALETEDRPHRHRDHRRRSSCMTRSTALGMPGPRRQGARGLFLQAGHRARGGRRSAGRALPWSVPPLVVTHASRHGD